MRPTLAELNTADQEQFAAICGSLFEHSPWIAERTWTQRPFENLTSLHQALVSTVTKATRDEQLALIRAHPDLVGRAALARQLTRESRGEQASAGLGEVTNEELAAFARYNAAYREKFGFPFVICARHNKKDAILAAFPTRLANGRDTEISRALDEIAKIAWLRLVDAVEA
jgi:2-oxo-4-hydroxy-4-carboxy-5-ureidoimidazoline decarboxylase